MEAQGSGVFNRLQDAKTEFHHQLFKSEHRNYYNPQDIEILDECRTVANVGGLHRLVGTCQNNKKKRQRSPRAAWRRSTSPRLTRAPSCGSCPSWCSTSSTHGSTTSRRSRSIT
ncbi:MAG: hypothetical protein ACKPKO_14720, partial [Candidatus Fonsibacter sp.]